MTFGFRYHLASLMAIFLSLILGILIGGALFPDHALVEEQALLIAELEERYRDAHLSQTSLQSELDLFTEAWTELLASISKDRLAAKTLVFVAEDVTGPEALTARLALTGAEVKQVTPAQALEIVPKRDMIFLFRLSEQGLSPNALETVQSLGEVAAKLVFFWDHDQKPQLSQLPASLQVDSIDKTLGEIALVLGLVTDLEGHFGVHQNAKRLFP